jgi:hypothetical protein
MTYFGGFEQWYVEDEIGEGVELCIKIRERQEGER